jgi:hypothetical protein
MRTKWDILQERKRAAEATAVLLQKEIEGLGSTPCVLTGPDGAKEYISCSRCGTEFETEADFAKHYLIPDERYLNLGECPNKEEK